MGSCFSVDEAKTIPVAEVLHESIKHGKVRFGNGTLSSVEAKIDDVAYILLQPSTCTSNPDSIRFAVVYNDAFKKWSHGGVLTKLQLAELRSLAEACGIPCMWVDERKTTLT